LKFQKNSRLLVKQDFQPVFDASKKVSSAFLLALYCPNERDIPRLGIILNKQRVKKSVTRNLIRRIIRESFRHSASELQALDIIVLIRGKPQSWHRADIRFAADELWKKLRSGT